MRRRRVQPESEESMLAPLQRIYDRREAHKDDPRANFALFPDVTNVPAVVGFVAKHPHPNVPFRFEDNTDSFTALARFEAATTATINHLRYMMVVAARKTCMSWTEIGDAQGFTTSAGQQAEQMHRRTSAWRGAHDLEVIPIYGEDVVDELEPRLVWVRRHEARVVATARELSGLSKALQGDEGVDAWLEFLDEALGAIDRGDRVGTGLATLLGTLADFIDDGEDDDGRKITAGLDAEQRAVLVRLRALVREYRAVAKAARSRN